MLLIIRLESPCSKDFICSLELYLDYYYSWEYAEVALSSMVALFVTGLEHNMYCTDYTTLEVCKRSLVLFFFFDT